MNKVIETIMKRRSVRLYEAKPIPKEILQILIDAGNAAPTGGNAQNWRFVVVENKSFKDKLMSLAIPRYKKWMEKAPTGLIAIRPVLFLCSNVMKDDKSLLLDWRRW